MAGEIDGVPAFVETSGEKMMVGADDQNYENSMADRTLPVLTGAPLALVRSPFPAGTVAPHDSIFDRMITISTIVWTSASGTVSLNPWTLYANLPVIMNRLSAWARCAFDLELAFEFSPSPYLYGLARVWYSPYHTMRTAGWTAISNYTGMACSAHGIDIDPSQPGTRRLVLPWKAFVSHFNPGQAGVLSQVGTLFFTPIISTRMSNLGTVEPLTITVRARALNLVRSMPTRAAAVAQSGPIGAGAKAVSLAVSGALPVVRTVATAVQAIAGGVSTLADMLGWSRTNTMSHAMITRPTQFCLTDSDDSALLVGLSVKDGVGDRKTYNNSSKVDEMSMAFFFSRVGVITPVQWSPLTVVGSVIATIPVVPSLVTGAMSGPGATFGATPLAYGSYPFALWRGSITFVVRVVCSNFHSGSLRLSWNPDWSSQTYDTDAVENCILEVKPGAEAEVTIGYAAPTPWLRMPESLTQSYGYTPATYPGFQTNGSFVITVVDPLTAPDTSVEAFLLIYVKGGPDFEVAVPRELPVSYTVDTSPPALMGDIEAEAAFVNNESAFGKCTFGIVGAKPGLFKDNVVGSTILSFRSLLHRYTFLGYLVVGTDVLAGTRRSKVVTCSNNLHETGFGGSGTLSNDTNIQVTLQPAATLFRWLKNVYMGHSGGARYRIRVANYTGYASPYEDALGPIRYMVAREIRTAAPARVVSAGADAVPMPNLISEVVGGTVEEYADFEIPDMNPELFTVGGGWKPVFGAYNVEWTISVTRAVTDATSFQYEIAKATATDFNFHTFCWIPTLTIP